MLFLLVQDGREREERPLMHAIVPADAAVPGVDAAGRFHQKALADKGIQPLPVQARELLQLPVLGKKGPDGVIGRAGGRPRR